MLLEKGKTAQSIVRNLVKIMIQLKRKVGAIPVEPTQRNTFYNLDEPIQNTSNHTINLSIAQDFDGREYIHNSIEDFCKCFLNDKLKGYTLIAHNSKGYDSQLFGRNFENADCPDLTKCHLRTMTLSQTFNDDFVFVGKSVSSI